MSFQVFISYSRADNTIPAGSGSMAGFVTLVHDVLKQELRGQGASDITIWRDKSGLEDGDQFTPKIQRAIDNSQMLLVVVTPASLKSRYCKQEIAAFDARWKDTPNSKDRVITVLREWIASETWPAPAQGQAGYRFYKSENDQDGAPETPFYLRDGKPTNEFYDAVHRIARFIVQRSLELGPIPSEQAPDGSRTIFVAQACDDMIEDYQTVVTELRNDGYNVVPDPDVRIPDSKSAEGQIAAELRKAECSIHLLGEVHGARDKTSPLADLQFDLAAMQAESVPAGTFRRFVFAPKVFVDPDDPQNAIDDRKSLEVRNRFGRGLDGDTVIGDGISDFVVEVKAYLKKMTPKPEPDTQPRLNRSGNVFVDFHPDDVAYARSLSLALRERGIRYRFAAVDDDRIENRKTNTDLLRNATAILYCWGNATDAWLYSEASGFEDWRALGRERPFDVRAAVVGPPDSKSKGLYDRESPPEAIDLYLDLSDTAQPTPESLNPLFGPDEPGD